VSVVAMAAGLAVLAGYVRRHTGSIAAALLAPALVLSNPILLYLPSTPMTGPLLRALSFLALAAVDRWVRAPTSGRRHVAGSSLMALMLTRYEGWCVAAALVIIGGWSIRQRGVRLAGSLVPYCAAAVIGFLLLSWGSTGRWFVASGFFVPDNPAHGRPWEAARQVAQGAHQLGGGALLAGGIAGLAVCLAAWRRGVGLLPAALLTTAALPWLAFVQGHPYRVRYMVPVVAASAVLTALAIGRLPARAAGIVAVAVAAFTWTERPPLDSAAAMVLEAQWETPYRREREANLLGVRRQRIRPARREVDPHVVPIRQHQHQRTTPEQADDPDEQRQHPSHRRPRHCRDSIERKVRNRKNAMNNRK
jgi:hypothetical protein